MYQKQLPIKTQVAWKRYTQLMIKAVEEHESVLVPATITDAILDFVMLL